MILGAHESVAGGLPESVPRALRDGCRALQVFTKSSGQWAARPFAPGETRAFRVAVRRAGLAVMAHDSYLINLAAPVEAMWRRSIEAFAEELRRCRALGIPRLVMHPGSPMDAGDEFGLSRVAAGLDEAFALAAVPRVRVLLETTAGQGRNLGWRFEHLAEILRRSKRVRRIGICVDTCHLLAAGYDFTTPKGYRRVFEELDRVVGLGRVEGFHLNDSKKPFGCRVDRHERIGFGTIGLEAFRPLVNDRRFARVPGVLETPPLPDGRESFAEGLRALRSLERGRS